MVVSPTSKCAGFYPLFTSVMRIELTAMCMQASALPQNHSPFSFVFWDRFKFPKLAFNSPWNTGPAFFSDPPGSASWAARITDLYHQVQLQNSFEILTWLFFSLKVLFYILKNFYQFFENSIQCVLLIFTSLPQSSNFVSFSSFDPSRPICNVQIF